MTKRRVRVPKPVLAMAAPAPEHPVVSIEKLKGGELNWSIRVPGTSLPRAIDRAVTEAKRLAAELAKWQAAEERRKDNLRSLLEAQRAKIDAEKRATAAP